MDIIEKALKKQQELSNTSSADKRDEKSNDSSVLLNELKQTEIVSKGSNTRMNDSVNKGESKLFEIDIERLKNLGFITSLQSNTLLNEELREIKRPLLRNIKAKGSNKVDKANVIQVTSSLPGEGKTFTSINLAMSIAMEFDYTVLLVDADVIKSAVSDTLGIHEERGLTDYLNRDVDHLSDVLLKTSIPKLSVLPAGTRKNLSTELLNSEFMDQLITEFSERYDDRIVIIDSPPLLATNESRIIAHKIGQIVFVVEHNRTTQASIKSALSLLDPDMTIGIILNKTRGSRGEYGYYGYYGYGDYGYGPGSHA